jgi:hypothetical protein
MSIGIRFDCGIGTAIVKRSIRASNNLDSIATTIVSRVNWRIDIVSSNVSMSFEVTSTVVRACSEEGD